MKEAEVVVDNYEKTSDILRSIGLTIKQEAINKRIRYVKEDVVYDIDFWAEIPPYVEIESTSMEKAKAAARELGFDPKEGLICSVNQVYKKYGYDLGEYSFVGPDGMVKNKFYKAAVFC